MYTQLNLASPNKQENSFRERNLHLRSHSRLRISVIPIWKVNLHIHIVKLSTSVIIIWKVLSADTSHKLHLEYVCMYTNLEGLVCRYIMSKGQYKKYYKTKKAGGIREYRIAMLLDMSESMKGPHGTAAIESLVAMTCALERMKLTNFSVATFGEEVCLIKADDTPWNAACKHLLLSRITQSKMVEMSSLDSDGVHHAVDVLTSSKGSGPTICFVFTDGYGSRGVKLSRELIRANSLGVMIVGVSLGVDDSFVSSSYQHWVNAVNAGALGEGIAKLFRGDGVGSSRDSHTKRAYRCVLEGQEELTSSPDAVTQIWSTHTTYFDDVKQKLAQDRTLHLHTRTVGPGGTSGQASVDVCFVMDCTGSMGSWIDACKQKVIFMCVCVYVCVCMCMYVYVCVDACKQKVIFMCVCVYVYVCVCMCMYVYVCVCMCMYVYACMHW
jgi:hypothetical protein